MNDNLTTPIRSILFDLDGTLRHNRPDAHDFFFGHAIDLGLEDRPEFHARAFRWAHHYWSSSDDLRQDLKEYPSRDDGSFWENYARRYLHAYSESTEQAEALTLPVRKHMNEHYRPENRVIPGTVEALAQLKSAGYTLGVLTNRNESCDDELVELGLMPYFDFALAAGQVGSWKPHPGIFEAALELSGTTPAESIYVGDNFYADIKGARNAGLQPVLIDPRDLFPDAGCPRIEDLTPLPSLVQTAI
jgi:putative hydrolase of the HAD superfamily